MLGFQLLDKTSTGSHHQMTEFVANIFISGESTFLAFLALRFVFD